MPPKMDNDIPKIDLPVDWVIGTDITKEILGLYTDYPCRLKAQIFVLCLGGEVEASVNLIRHRVKPFDFITILPGSIMQIHRIEGDIRLYFLGFSSDFIQHAIAIRSMKDVLFAVRENPVIPLQEKGARLMEDYFSLLLKTYEFCEERPNRELSTHLFSGILLGLGMLYRTKVTSAPTLSKSEQLSKDFGQLVMQYYMQERQVSFYAKLLGITPSYLCTTIKQVTGKTCIEIISEMVVIDAKAQLKSTDLSIRDIAYSLNFTNMSFFGKYFKRYTGQSPQEYRNS